MTKQSRLALRRCSFSPLAGEKVGMRGPFGKLGLAERPPHPARKSAPTSPRKRGEVRTAAKCDCLCEQQHASPSSTRPLQLAIGRFAMIRISQAPSVANFPQPPARDRRRGAMRLGMTLPNRANSLFRQMNSLFGPKNSLFSFEQGIRLQAVDPSLNLFVDRMPNLTNSLLISLLSGNLRPRPAEAHYRVSASLEHFLVRLTSFVLSSPGLTGRSSKDRPWILDCPVKPGNDTGRISLIEKTPRRRASSRA